MTDTTEKTIPPPASVYGCVLIYILIWYLARDRRQQAQPARQPAMPSRNSSRLRVGSLNIRYAPNPNAEPPAGPSPNAEYPWTGYRKEALLDQIAWEEPDVIGFQEVLWHQFQDLKKGLSPVYDSVGVGRIDGKQDGEACPIFYRKDRFELLSVEHFWLSETPDVPGSIAWDAALTRMATLVHLRDRYSGQEDSPAPPAVHDLETGARYTPIPTQVQEDIWIANTHFDHMGIVARAKSSEVILSKLRPHMMHWNDVGQPPLVMVMGDLNSPPEEEGYQVLTGHRYAGEAAVASRSDMDAGLSFLDTRHAVALRAAPSGRAMAGLPVQILLKKQYGCIGTFSEFGKNIDGAVIDHIMVADNGALQPATPASKFAVSEKTTGIPKDHGGGNWRVTKYGVIPNKTEDGQYPYRLSDHCLVMSELSRAS